jgi:site-specific DNA recombinase
MRIGIYARVSTQRQAQANGLAQQLERLQAHALQQGWSVAAEDIFRDDGYSGASLKRPGSGCEIGRRCVNWIAS